MANYEGACRSNYFQVKDLVAFRIWTDSLPDLHRQEDKDGFVTLYDTEGEGWPFSRYDDEAGDYVEIKFIDELIEHLAEDSVAVLMEAGHEKRTYISGGAVAVDSEGHKVELFLHQIYKLAVQKLDGEVFDHYGMDMKDAYGEEPNDGS